MSFIGAIGIKSVVELGVQAGKVLNKALEQLPTRDQRVMKEFFKFIDRYHEEVMREDCDHDDLIVWKQRKDDLMDTIIEQLRKGR